LIPVAPALPAPAGGLASPAATPVDPRAVAIEFLADTPNRWSQLVLLGDLAPFLPPVG
jgi:hypothetical protein